MTQHPWFLWFAMLVGLLTGCLLGAQPSVNGYLGRHTFHPLQASTISFASGTVLLVIITVALGVFPPRLKVPLGEIPWWAWFGGAIGTVMVTTSLMFVPRIGALKWFAVVMTGQVFAALMLDHFGWLGTPKQPASLLRLIGAAMLILGILCINNSRRPSTLQRPPVSSSPSSLEGAEAATQDRSHDAGREGESPPR